MTDNVFIALQANEEARPIIEAIEEDNPEAQVEHQPAMVRITAPGRLVVRRETVSEKIGRDWDPQEIHLVLISMGGNINESDDEFIIEWQH